MAENQPPICPACKRANAVKRATCFYCGKDLPRPDGVTAAPQEEKPKIIRRTGTPGYLLVLIPGPQAMPEVPYSTVLMEQFRLDPYLWNQWLRAKTPRIVRHLKTENEARESVRVLKDLGLSARAITSDDLYRVGYSFRPKTVEFQPGEMVFTSGSEVLRIKPPEAFLLVRGKITVQKNPAKTGSRAKEQGEEAIEEETSNYEAFDLFTLQPDAPPIRVKTTAFDFSGLLAARTDSSLLNFAALIKKFQEFSPDLRIDESFRLVTPVFTDDKTAGLFDPTQEYISKNLFYQNNERQFDQHARLVFYLSRAEAV